MRHNPADWDTYTKKQKDEFYEKSLDERREIINKSYLSLITDENGNLDVMKVLECIMNLQDDLDDLKYEVNWLDNNCVKNEDSYYG